MLTQQKIVVIGSSAGGIEALSLLVPQFGADFPAPILLVQHLPTDTPSMLPRILARFDGLKARFPQDHDPLTPGTIYVAPRDQHMLIQDGHVRLTFGPEENRSRPSVDPLFRSAAMTYSSNVMGIILSGMMNDGSSGLLAIKRCGGTAMVQTPDEAAYPMMPQSALDHAPVDHCVPIEEMGEILRQWVHAPLQPPFDVPDDIRSEVQIAQSVSSDIPLESNLGNLSPVICPDCGGPLWEIQVDDIPRYRCHVGHAFTAESLLDGQSHKLEHSLWAALRLMEERARMLDKMAREAEANGRMGLAANYRSRGSEAGEHAGRIRQLLVSNNRPMFFAAD